MSQKLSSSELRIQLMSSDESIALHAIELLKSSGKANAIAPLLEALASSEYEAVKREAREMLSAMRVKNAEEELVQALELLSILEVEEGVYSEEEQLGAMSFLRSVPQENFTREEKIIFNDILRSIDTLIINE